MKKSRITKSQKAERGKLESFSDDELARAVELMVSPFDLTIREVAEALLTALDFSEDDVREHLASGCYLNDARLSLGGYKKSPH